MKKIAAGIATIAASLSLDLSTKRTRKTLSLVALLLAGFTLSNSALATNYTITDLGTLAGYGPYLSSRAYGINDNGQVVGYSSTAPNSLQNHAFLYSNGTMTGLGTLGGTSSYAYDINNAGKIVGHAFTANNAAQHAFLYSNNTMTDLGSLAGTKGTSRAFAINNNDQIVGFTGRTGYSYFRPFLYSNGIMTDLDARGNTGGGYAYGINDNNEVVGSTRSAALYNRDHAALYSKGQTTDLGTLGGEFPASTANDINDSGHIVGYSNTAVGGNHAFLYKDNALIDLGTLAGGTTSSALAINNKGQIVGTSFLNGLQTAFLYDGTTMRNLNGLLPGNSGWKLGYAEDINNLGQIVGWGSHNGIDRAFLMTPTAPVPEPETYAMMLAGLGLLGFMKRRRKQQAAA
jgi:probable HAF family extracellular repeat protein